MSLGKPIVAILAASISFAGAAAVQIDYALSSGSAAIDPFTITDPTSGADFTLSPSLVIDSGSFVATFPSDEFGAITDGAASISSFTFVGSLDIEISTVFDLGFPITVSANLVGPLTGTQITESFGTLAGLLAYAETEVGNYDAIAGPLDCMDGLGGLVCGGIETALGTTFPITQIAGDDTPLPFTGGTFDGLNGGSPSTAGNTLDLSVPIDDTNSFGFEVDFTWNEIDRLLVIPEPSTTLLLVAGAALALRRRRL
jgi:hypothetical protein